MPNNYQHSKGLVKHENLVSQELIEVKFLRKKYNEADVSTKGSCSKREIYPEMLAIPSILRWKFRSDQLELPTHDTVLE